MSAHPIPLRPLHSQMQETSTPEAPGFVDQAKGKLSQGVGKAFGWMEEGGWKGAALSAVLIAFSIFMIAWGIPHMGMINYNDVGVGSVTTIAYLGLALGVGIWGLYTSIKKRFSPHDQFEMTRKKENIKLAIFGVILAGLVVIGALGMKQSLAGHNIGGNSWVTTGLALGFAGIAGLLTIGYMIHNRKRIYRPLHPVELQQLKDQGRKESEAHAAKRAAVAG